MIELRLLGSVTVEATEAPAAARLCEQPKRLAVLAYLAVALPRGPWMRDALLPFFWPDLDQQHARAALRKTIFHLRRALGAGVVQTRGAEEIRIARELLRCDAVEFDTLLDSGCEATALERYRGDLMAGFHLAGCPDFERWLEGERARLRRRAARAIWLLAEQAASSGAGDLTSLVHRALDLNPLDEGGVRRAMHLLARAGDTGGAVDVFERYRTRLAEDHSVSPDPKTAAILDGLRPGTRARQPVVEAPSVERTADLPAEAYREYQRGRHQLLRRTPTSLERCVHHLRRATALAPDFGPAHAALAECFSILPVYTAAAPAEVMPLALAAASKALALDASLGAALGARAYAALVYEWDWDGAERDYARALALDPANALVRAVYALYPLTCTGQHESAIAHVERARADDPLSLPVGAYSVFVHMFARQFDAALERANDVVEHDDDFVLGHWVRGSTLQCMGQAGRAIDEYRRTVELTRGSALMRTQLACGLAADGQHETAVSILDDLRRSRDDPPYFAAMALTQLGRNGEAMSELNRAYRERSVHLVFLNVDPRFDALSGDPRFRELVLRIGLRPH